MLFEDLGDRQNDLITEGSIITLDGSACWDTERSIGVLDEVAAIYAETSGCMPIDLGIYRFWANSAVHVSSFSSRAQRIRASAYDVASISAIEQMLDLTQ